MKTIDQSKVRHETEFTLGRCVRWFDLCGDPFCFLPNYRTKLDFLKCDNISHSLRGSQNSLKNSHLVFRTRTLLLPPDVRHARGDGGVYARLGVFVTHRRRVRLPAIRELWVVGRHERLPLFATQRPGLAQRPPELGLLRRQTVRQQLLALVRQQRRDDARDQVGHLVDGILTGAHDQVQRRHEEVHQLGSVGIVDERAKTRLNKIYFCFLNTTRLFVVFKIHR